MRKSVVGKLRAGVVSALVLPFGLAAFAAALTSGEPPLEIMAPILALLVCVLAVCWARVVPHWRAQRGPDDDDEPWRRDGAEDDPRLPDGGTGGPEIDWPAFERDFAAYVEACERTGDRILTPAG